MISDRVKLRINLRWKIKKIISNEMVLPNCTEYQADRHLYGHLKHSPIYIHKSIVSFFIFIFEEEGVLYINRVSGWRNMKDDPADTSSKAFLELLV